jgi:hypothetical protein
MPFCCDGAPGAATHTKMRCHTRFRNGSWHIFPTPCLVFNHPLPSPNFHHYVPPRMPQAKDESSVKPHHTMFVVELENEAEKVGLRNSLVAIRQTFGVAVWLQDFLFWRYIAAHMHTYLYVSQPNELLLSTVLSYWLPPLCARGLSLSCDPLTDRRVCFFYVTVVLYLHVYIVVCFSPTPLSVLLCCPCSAPISCSSWFLSNYLSVLLCGILHRYSFRHIFRAVSVCPHEPLYLLLRLGRCPLCCRCRV